MSGTEDGTPVTVNGKVYLVGEVRRAGTFGKITVPHDYVYYFGTRDGKRFGPVRSGTRASRPGTVGRILFDAADAADAGTVEDVTVCQYSAAHSLRGVVATTVVHCGPTVGTVPACQACADFYARL